MQAYRPNHAIRFLQCTQSRSQEFSVLYLQLRTAHKEKINIWPELGIAVT